MDEQVRIELPKEGETFGVWVKTNGTMTRVDPENGTDFELEQLRTLVTDGEGNHTIEIVDCISDPDAGLIMVLNEEGKLLGLEFNLVATQISGFYPHDVIVGNVLVCRHDGVK